VTDALDPLALRQRYDRELRTRVPDKLPDGQVFHAAGPSAGGWMVIAVHESQESWERFRDLILLPRMQAGIPGGFESPPQETVMEVDTLLP